MSNIEEGKIVFESGKKKRKPRRIKYKEGGETTTINKTGVSFEMPEKGEA